MIRRPSSRLWLRLLLVGTVGSYALNDPAAEATAASDNPASLVTPDALVEGVLQNNPELNFYRAEIRAAKGERVTAGLWGNPELSSTMGGKHVRSGGLADEGLAWMVSVQQPFEWPGRIALRKAIADKQVKLAELGLSQFQTSLAARAKTLAYNLFAAQEKSAAAQEVAERLRQLLEVLVQRDPAGLTPRLEIRILEATQLTLQRKATEAALETTAALLELNQLRSQPWTNVVKVARTELDFAATPSQESLLAAARTNNFELQIRRVELEQQGFRVSLAQKDGRPTVSVGPYYSRERAGDDEQQFGIGLSVPLPLWNRNQGNVAAAEARLSQAQTLLFVAERDLDRRVLQTAVTYETKLEEMSKWRREAIDEFRQAAELADRHYRLGAVPITTYVELQKQYLEAVEALLDTRREALQAQQELERLTGLPLSAIAQPRGATP